MDRLGDTKTVFALEDHYRDTPQMADAVERMKADPGVGRDALIEYPRARLPIPMRSSCG
jgi:hypothetical protein